MLKNISSSRLKFVQCLVSHGLVCSVQMSTFIQHCNLEGSDALS